MQISRKHVLYVISMLVFGAQVSIAQGNEDLKNRVTELGKQLAGPGVDQACHDLDTIRAIYGLQPLNWAVDDMIPLAYVDGKHNAGCIISLLDKMPIEGAVWSAYVRAVTKGGPGMWVALPRLRNS